MKCAIYGAGSLGTVLGAYMTKNGVPVELVNRNAAHVEALRKSGAHITGTVEAAFIRFRRYRNAAERYSRAWNS